MNILGFKLYSGEEMVAEVEEETETTYEIKNPQIMVQTGPNQMSFMPWFGMAESANTTARTLSFPKDMVFMTETPVLNVKDHYEKTFGVGIVTPKESEIVLPA